jgi:hypothetical protein
MRPPPFVPAFLPTICGILPILPAATMLAYVLTPPSMTHFPPVTIIGVTDMQTWNSVSYSRNGKEEILQFYPMNVVLTD